MKMACWKGYTYILLYLLYHSFRPILGDDCPYHADVEQFVGHCSFNPKSSPKNTVLWICVVHNPYISGVYPVHKWVWGWWINKRGLSASTKQGECQMNCWMGSVHPHFPDSVGNSWRFTSSLPEFLDSGRNPDFFPQNPSHPDSAWNPFSAAPSPKPSCRALRLGRNR